MHNQLVIHQGNNHEKLHIFNPQRAPSRKRGDGRKGLRTYWHTPTRSKWRRWKWDARTHTSISRQAPLGLANYLTITNWRLLIILALLIGGSFWSLQVKSSRILGRQSKKIKKSINSHKNQKHPAINSATLIIIAIDLLYFSYKLPTFAIMKID